MLTDHFFQFNFGKAEQYVHSSKILHLHTYSGVPYILNVYTAAGICILKADLLSCLKT